MTTQGLNIAPPPRKSKAPEAREEPSTSQPSAAKKESTSRAVSFETIAGEDKVQFNKRITRNTADGFEVLAIKTRKKVPQLLEEALELLESKYGKS